jgi:hypothetical protein
MINEQRAHYVLDECRRLSESIESDCERLCLFIAEAKREKYWRLLYKTQDDWMSTVFPGKSFHLLNQMGMVGEDYRNEPGAISEIGVSKAYIIKNMPDRKSWIAKAKHCSKYELSRQVKWARSTINSRSMAIERIRKMRIKLEALDRERNFILDEIVRISEDWQLDGECMPMVSSKSAEAQL